MANLEPEVRDTARALKLVLTHSYNVREVREHEHEIWQEFLASSPNSHVMQGWAWGEYKRQNGWKPVRLAVMQDDSMIAAAQLLIRGAGGISFGYVPKGPVCPSSNLALYAALLDSMHEYARRERSIFLRVVPDELVESGVEHLMRAQGFVCAPNTMRPSEPGATFLVDLTGGPDAVLARMKKRTREYIRSAGRKLDVRVASQESDIVAFHALMMELSERKDFAAKPLSYYRTLLETLGPGQEAVLLLAELDGEVVAGIVALRLGTKGIFSHSSSRAAHQKAHANQFLQWKAMEWCMQHGCTHYDLGGVDDPRRIDENGKMVLLPVDPEAMSPEMKGLFDYKKSFGGELVRYAGAFDYVYNRPLYRLWRKMARVQAEGTDILHMMQNQLQSLRRKQTSREE